MIFMKRVIYTSISLLFLTISVFGQSSETKKADKYFNSLSYIKAAEAYENVLGKDSTSYVLQRLGDCYYLNSNMKKASLWYEKLFEEHEEENIDAGYFFKYAQALRGVGNYKDSDSWMKRFHQKRKKDVRGLNFSMSENNITDLTPSSPSFKVENVSSLNTPNSEYGVAFFEEGIVYASTKSQGNLVKRKHAWNNKGFLDLFSATVTEDGTISEKKPIKELNSKYHESSVAFSPDYKTIYFTRNNYIKKKLGKDKGGFTNLKIYSAELIDGKWENVTELPFNNDDYSIGHPAVSSDGKNLFFVSDMPGSFGETDIFYVAINGNNTFGPVQTLGLHVNTEGREMFPYVLDNKLYFSSDGHFGLGGLDVFVSEEKNGEFQPPVNLKSPINTQSDDFAFIMNASTNKGYFSSNREEGSGDDDIYSFTYTKKEEIVIVKKPDCKQSVFGVVKDRFTDKLLKGATVTIYNRNDEKVEELKVGNDASFSFSLPCGASYKLIAFKRYYKPNLQSFKIEREIGDLTTKPMELKLEDDFKYSSNNKIIINTDIIYFDVNKSDIRPDAALELNKVVAIMKKYPELIVESASYTDSRGNDDYNQKLSERRARSSMNYIISKGISSSRISGKGYGEIKPVNKCINGVWCNDKAHQLNRRTEFVVIIKN